jgi:iron complex transport system permease protein
VTAPSVVTDNPDGSRRDGPGAGHAKDWHGNRDGGGSPAGAPTGAGGTDGTGGRRRWGHPRRPARTGFVVLRSDRLGVSVRAEPRSMLVTIVLLAGALGIFAWGLTVGDFPIPLSDVLDELVGDGNSDSAFIVRTLRMPRGLTALLVGAAFGLSGAIFQRIARNPLASPDIIGVSQGAAAAALFVIVILGGSSNQVTSGALFGALATATGVYLLAYKRGITGYRLVLVGIGITAMMQSIVSYLLTRAEIQDAQQAAVWLTGSLNNRGWDHVRPITWALALLLPAALFLARHLRTLELGDDAAKGLGVRVEGVRSGLLLVGVALAAVAVASAGPVSFVALMSPQVTRRLIAERSLGLLPAAAGGAFLLASADLVARRVMAPTELPVGVVTAILGAPFLLWLLVRANKIGSAG